MTYSDIINKFHEIIGQNDFKAFFSLSKKYTRLGAKSYQDLLLLESKYNEIKHESHLGTISETPKEVAFNKLRASILHWTNHIPFEDVYQISDPEKILASFKSYESTIKEQKLKIESLERQLKAFKANTFQRLETLQEIQWWNQLTEEWKRLFEKNIGSNPSADEIRIMFEELEFLNCRASNIKGLFPLRRFQNLKFLDISHTSIDDLTPIQNLTSLRKLYFQNTKVKHLDPVKNLVNLEYIMFHDTPVYIPFSLEKLVNLKLVVCKTYPSEIERLKKILPDCTFENKV
jgi:Leucine-rich repeat (LRR) protein